MALNSNQIPKYATTINNDEATLVNGDGAGALGTITNANAVFTSGSSGAILEALTASSDDTSAVNAIITIDRAGAGTSIMHLGVVNIPTLSGTNGSADNVDILDAIVGLPVNSQGKKYVKLEASDVVYVSALTAVTAAKTVWFSAQGGDF